MLSNHIIPSFAGSTLNIYASTESGIRKIHADKYTNPVDATWGMTEVAPASVPVSENTFIVVKGGTFPAIIGYRNSSVYGKAISLGGSVFLIPVKYDLAGTDTIELNDGYTENSLSITIKDTTAVAGSFAITTAYNNTLDTKGSQYIAIEGTGMNNVAKITDPDSQENEFNIVNDSWLIIKTSSQGALGARVFTFKDAGENTLGTQSFTFASTNTVAEEAYFHQNGDMVSVYTSDIKDNATIVTKDSGTYYSSIGGIDDFIEYRNEIETRYTYIVRDLRGNILPYVTYTVCSIDGETVVTGHSDDYGVISIDIDLVPSRFVLEIDRSDIPQKRIYVNI